MGRVWDAANEHVDWHYGSRENAWPASQRYRRCSRFDDLCLLLEHLGFEKRVRGSHHVFRKVGVEEKINLQRAGTNAKPYQVKQVRAVIFRAELGFKQ